MSQQEGEDASYKQDHANNNNSSSPIINYLNQLFHLFYVVFITPILQFIQNPQLGTWNGGAASTTSMMNDMDSSSTDHYSHNNMSLKSTTTSTLNNKHLSVMMEVSTHTPRGSKRIMVGEENQQNKAQIIRERIMMASSQQGSLLMDDDEDDEGEYDDEEYDGEEYENNEEELQNTVQDPSSCSSTTENNHSMITITPSEQQTTTPTTSKVPKLSFGNSSSSSPQSIHVRSRSSGVTGSSSGGGVDSKSLSLSTTTTKIPSLPIGSLPVVVSSSSTTTSNDLSHWTAPSTLSARGRSASTNRASMNMNSNNNTHHHYHYNNNNTTLESSPHMRLVNNEIERLLQTPNACELKLNSLTLTIFPHKLFNLFKTHKITKMNVSDNRLTSLSYHFTNSFPYLEELNLSRNLFTSMFNDFNKLKYLRVLDLSYNGFEILPQNVLQCTQLQELYLNNNSLIALQPDIAKLQQLQVLDISNNLLSKLPDELTLLKNLKKLNVSNNKYIDSAMKIIMDLYKQNPNLERDISVSEDDWSHDHGNSSSTVHAIHSGSSSSTTTIGNVVRSTFVTTATTTATATTSDSMTTTPSGHTESTSSMSPNKTERNSSSTKSKSPSLHKTSTPPKSTSTTSSTKSSPSSLTTTTTTTSTTSTTTTTQSPTNTDALTTKRVYSILELIESEFKYKNYLETLFNEFMLPISNCDDLQQQGQLKFIGCGIQDGPQFVKKIFPPDLENILKCSQMFYRELVKILQEPSNVEIRSENHGSTNDTSSSSMMSSNHAQSSNNQSNHGQSSTIPSKKRKNSELNRSLLLLKKQIYEHPVGQVFQRFIPFFKVYIDYQSHYSRTVHQNLPQAYSQYPKFKQVIEMAKTVTGTDGLDISSLLIMPCQRIVKYCLLIKAIMKETPTDHPDYPLLEIASTKMQATAHEINRKMKDIANLRNLIDIASQYSIDGLVVSTRRFISTTSVKIYIVPSSSSSSGGGGNSSMMILPNTSALSSNSTTSSSNMVIREKAKIHLFNDRILFTTVEDSHYYFSVGSLLGRNPSELYKLSEVELLNAPTMDSDDKTKVSLNILPKSSHYIVECESESVCNTLTQQLRDLLTVKK